MLVSVGRVNTTSLGDGILRFMRCWVCWQLVTMVFAGSCLLGRSFTRTVASVKAARRSTVRHLTTNIVVVGKRNGGEEWISSGCAEYEKRLKPVLNLNTVFLKSDDDLIDAANSAKGIVIALDEKGKQFTSHEFTEMLYDCFLEGGSTVTFLIGGFAGLPASIRSKYRLISLSKLTWTHTMARLLLTEQIYRATEIRKGSSYHKE